MENKYDPAIHHRRSIRLQCYDYTQIGLYFITICCHDKICYFGKIENGEIVLNDFGKIAYNELVKLPERYPDVLSDVFQIMPNHVHAIIEIVGATLAVAQNTDSIRTEMHVGTRAGASPAPTVQYTVGNIIGAYKSRVANQCLEILKFHNKHMGKLWQRNYYEHIIRNDESYHNIVDYIINNPVNWEKDKLYMDC